MASYCAGCLLLSLETSKNLYLDEQRQSCCLPLLTAFSNVATPVVEISAGLLELIQLNCKMICGALCLLKSLP